MGGLKVRHPISHDVISMPGGTLVLEAELEARVAQPELIPVRDSRDHHAGQYGQLNRDGRRHGRSGHKAERSGM
jgi:hypothetical protein